MLNSIKKIRGIFQAKEGRLIHFFFLAMNLMALNVVSYTLGSSLFLTHVGSDRLPLFYLFIGSISILGYTWLAQVVDKFPRERLFRYVLLGGIAFGLVLGLLNIPHSVVAYYVIFIIFAFQWNFHLDILFPSLVSDYFTTLEYKSYAPRLAIAQAVGGLLGGALTSWLAVKMATHNLLLVLPVFCAVAMGQISYLERSFTQLEGSVEEGVGNLRTFVLLVKSTPIVFFLASSTLVFFILYTFAQFQYFTIYAQVFPNDQQLTDFLGKIWILGNGVQLVVLSCFTQPLLPRLGVTRMNLVYPITTLASFIGLAVNFNLPSAIFAYVNNEPLDQSINQPTHTLNYNAVPHSFVGRVRAIADGTFLGLGFILAGALLLPASSFLTPSQITWIGIGLCCGFGLLRYFQNKSYLQSLLSMLRSGSVNLDDCDSGLTFLPVAYNQEVAQLLASKERDNRILGLELAARLQNPKVMFPEILALLPEADYEVRGALIKLIVSNRARETLLPQLQQEIENLLAGDNPRKQAIALEVAIATGKKLPSGEDMGGVPEVTALAKVAASQNKLEGAELEGVAGMAVTRAILYSGNPELIPILGQILTHGPVNVRCSELRAMATLAHPDHTLALAPIATAQLSHPVPEVRAAAFGLVAVLQSLEMLPHVVRGLEDTDPAVRREAATALASYGDKGLSVAKEYLYKEQTDIVEAAIAAIGQVRTTAAKAILLDYLAPDFERMRGSPHPQRSGVGKDSAENSWVMPPNFPNM